MLQQTQVNTAIPYYKRFLRVFPSFEALSQAPLGRVLKNWEGLGYYSRARSLHALAKIIARKFDGKLPSQASTLQGLPGIGRYTAGAVRSIAFGLDAAVVDGNVQRVFARYFGITQDLSNSLGQRRMWALAESLVPRRNAGLYNQALMDIGALVCMPKNPACTRCPLRFDCRALRLKIVHRIPFKRKTKKLPHYHIGAGVIWKAGRILISQRPLEGLLGGLWEFPGGKRNPSESIPRCIEREIREELGVRVRAGEKLAEINQAYSHFKITLHAHHCRYVNGNPQTLGCRAWRWILPKDLEKYAFPAANQPIIRQLLGNTN